MIIDKNTVYTYETVNVRDESIIEELRYVNGDWSLSKRLLSGDLIQKVKILIESQAESLVNAYIHYDIYKEGTFTKTSNGKKTRLNKVLHLFFRITNGKNVKYGTFGNLLFLTNDYGKFPRSEYLKSLEHNGDRRIPVGDYLCEKGYDSKTKQYFYSINNVPNRADTKIAIGNTLLQNKGDIFIGLDFNQNRDGLYGSTLAFEELGEALSQAECFVLKIIG